MSFCLCVDALLTANNDFLYCSIIWSVEKNISLNVCRFKTTKKITWLVVMAIIPLIMSVVMLCIYIQRVTEIVKGFISFLMWHVV